MPKHIQRLILVFAAILVIFLIIRKVLIPDSFGDFGHYRGLALDENKAIEAKYVGESICGDCHDDYMELKMSDLHAGISCETCHGNGIIQKEETIEMIPILPWRNYNVKPVMDQAGSTLIIPYLTS